MAIRRFLSLWLPRLSTDRARRLSGVDPGAAARRRRQARRTRERLVCVDAAAARLGLSAGLTLADARARHPALVASRPSRRQRRASSKRLADWCSRYTPLVALDGADGLMLDISGVAHLFGGEAALAEDCRARLAARGFAAVFGVAGNPRAACGARALFDARRSRPSALRDKAFARLFHDLPLAALGLATKPSPTLRARA